MERERETEKDLGNLGGVETVAGEECCRERERERGRER